jgi:leader peptidase (prepilin peptidase)/N-methyltransferase
MMMLPPAVMSALIVIFGLLIGSFLNVVIHRLPLEQSIVSPGSHCPHCGNAVRWYQNIPLISYLFLRGKCANCAAKIHWRYPLVEFLTGVMFLIAFRGSIDIAQFRIWFFIAIGIAITFIDLDHRIIPDELSLGGWAVGLLTAYWDFRNGFGHLLLASFVGFGFFWLLSAAYEKLRNAEGLGFGDVKFMGTIGAFTGFGGIWSSLLISSILGVVVGLVVARLSKSEDMMKTAIPYGPFLVVGAVIEQLYEVSKWMNI